MFGSGGMNLITTIIGFGMSATFIVFVCTRLICGRLRGVESRQMFEIDSGIDLEQPEHPNSGVEPVIVAAIPTMKFNHEAFSSMEDVQCSICLGEYQEKEVLRIMPKCGHSFHLSCIDVWLRKQSTCPVCRLPIKESLDPKHIRRAVSEITHTAGSSEASHIRRAVSEITHTAGSSEVSVDRSQQWILQGADRSVGNGSNQGLTEPSNRSQ